MDHGLVHAANLAEIARLRGLLEAAKTDRTTRGTQTDHGDPMVLNAGIIAGRSPPGLRGPDEHTALARILKASEMEKQSGVHVVEVISGGRKTMRYQRVSNARVPDEDAKAPLLKKRSRNAAFMAVQTNMGSNSFQRLLHMPHQWE